MAGAPIRIADADDPRIATFRAIRERDLVGREGRFVAEGTVVLRMLAASHAAGGRFRAEAVLVLENRLAGIAAVLDSLPADVPVHVADRAVFNAIAGFDMHRGVVAIGRREAAPAAGTLIASLPADSLVLAACGISNHDNMGSLFRNAAAFGVDAILLDETCCDPLYRKAIRVSVGAVLSVPFTREGGAQTMLEALADAGFEIWALSPRGEAPIGSIVPAGRLALVAGTEGEGLPATILSRFHTARIPQKSGLDSLNVATASGVALYQMALAKGRIG
ncbi:RNA methyltransferase [Rhizobium sp. TRM96647]|uniref:TrmH family RNA methyltransferase n=1 Tax=unclassified Rhizobium TaxID=2613769 RepID=UPI0021E9610B|nr:MULTISPECIES: RNA methyltransferase [unclassified Rhizobium]MCV3735830.1 RNA methyltransferase [Rhizobium sp. TRM96647]MCV3758508.1 RNA methyltransferase [Rhizobium sp. TRM96650]